MNELRAFLDQMDGAHRRSAICRIADACCVTRPTVSEWIKENVDISDIKKIAINKEFRQEIFKL